MASTDVHRRIAAALARIATLTRSQGQRAAQEEALSALQGRVLALLLGRGELRVGELTDELLVAYGTASEAISALESKGLVRKATDPEEHRAVVVRLTRKGGAAARRLEGWPDDVLGPVIDDLRGDDAAALLASLVRLIQGFERRGLISTTRMCVSCRFFRPQRGRGAKPHYCELLRASIGNADLRVDCAEFEAAEPAQLDACWEALRSGGT